MGANKAVKIITNKYLQWTIQNGICFACAKICHFELPVSMASYENNKNRMEYGDSMVPIYTAKKIFMVDHAIEFGATNIYKSQTSGKL